MDVDDPIQQLLKNTGWSCDDLLDKLQRYKAQKGNNTEGESNHVKLCTEKDTSVPNKININHSKDELVHSETNKLLDTYSEAKNSETNFSKTREDFSDTDEEETEVNTTQSNIIDEIIDDIASEDKVKELSYDFTSATQSQKDDTEEQEEVTEVRIIRIEEDDEDNSLEEDSSFSETKYDNIEYLETFPRKAPDKLKTIDLTDSDDCIDGIGTDETQNDDVKKVIDNGTSKFLLEEVNTTCDKDLDLSMSITNNDNTSINEENVNNSSLNTTTIYKNNCEKVLNSIVISKEDSSNNTEKVENYENQNIDESEQENPSLTDLEDLRNNLKLQLSSLRTRKKGHFLEQLRANVVDSLDFNKKIKSTTSKDQNKNIEKTDEKNTHPTSSIKNIPAEEKGEDLYTQTNEFGLVILSVEGGIDLEESNKEVAEQTETANEDSANTCAAVENSFGLENDEVNDACGVLDEIRKIIQKQRHNNLKRNRDTTEKSVTNFSMFGKSTDIPTCSTKEIPEEKSNLMTTSDNSLSSYSNDDTSQTVDKNSPFISNTLDEFLTENSKLNISYNVPKCGAEEGLTENYRAKSPLVLKRVITPDKEDIHVSKKPGIKAKTVAQKRKLLEKQRLKDLKKKTKTKNEPEKGSPVKFTDISIEKNHSYIEINNKKLWVKGIKPNTCVAKINSSNVSTKTVKIIPHQKRKLSLLTELEKKSGETIKYLPGPLSKKSTLQINCLDNWETQTKILPKIILEVTPKIGQCLPPNIICRLPQHDGLVTENLAEFAVSVLKTKDDNAIKEKIFKFPMKYMNNQENIIVKKRKVTPLNYSIQDKTSKYNIQERSKETSVDNVVANIIHDLIRYVEIKEIAPTLIREDDTEYSSNDDKLEKMPTIADNISSIMKKPQKKKSKVEMELLRLNCKVVNVEVEENTTEEVCKKPYCQLGCVYKSLKCDGMLTYHCQNVGCMLECKCTREKSIEYDKVTLPAGTDILSRDTVTRIEDEAKKDLAKVEREFTQTVIHTNDKTIVVGVGGRHKTRRCAKAPIKYSDYIDSNFETIEQRKLEKLQEKKSDFTRQCFVDLARLNLKGIIPFCLFHNLYNCHCQRKSISSINTVPNIAKVFAKSDKIEKKSPSINKFVKSIKVAPSKPWREPYDLDVSTGSIENQMKIKTTSSGRTIRTTKKYNHDFNYPKERNIGYSSEHNFQPTDCARTREVAYNHRTKHKIPDNVLKKLTRGDFTNKITQADMLKSKMLANCSDPLESDILKRHLVLELENHKNLIENVLNENKHKRKQILEVRKDDSVKPSFSQDLAIQRRKKSGVAIRKVPVIESVFEGEIIVDETNMDLLQKMGPKTVKEGYARLLPWLALSKNYNKGDIKIWCMVDQPSRLLINKGDKTPPKNYVDIRQATQTTEVILWILSGKLPSRYREEHVSFILKQTKDNYEICGLCTKNLTKASNSTNTESESPANDVPNQDDILFTHKDLNGVLQVLFLSKGNFKLQELVEENVAFLGETSIEKHRLYMWAALPEIYSACKWRMIFLNSDFTFLYFIKVKYSIKYTDLLNASNKAKEGKCTIILRNSTICSMYDHSAFGIYFDSHYQDRLFIGPYFKQHKEDDIETLRYINQSLVCNESFNKMRGQMNYRCGHWLIERPYHRFSKVFGKVPEKGMVDLTRDQSPKIGKKRKVSVKSPTTTKKPKCESKTKQHIIITEGNECIKVLDSQPKKPEDFNRYIITNIPHLGYLGAFWHQDSSEIDVSWPFENKMLRFSSVQSATNFLQNRFSSLLQPVPETFKINIIVMTNIDLDKTEPIDASILSGHYICGEFGCYNIKTVTNEFCIDKIGFPREELLKMFAKRAQIFVRQKIEELADTVKISKDEVGRFDIVHILNKAKEEVESLKLTEKQHIVEKNDLIIRKQELTLKVLQLISFLPEAEKQREERKIKQIFKSHPLLISKVASEPIEIPDSDDEKQDTSNQNKDETMTEQIETSPQLKPDTRQVFPARHLKIVPLDENIPKKGVQSSVIASQRKLKSILKPKPSMPTSSGSPPEPSSLGQPVILNFKQSVNKTSPQILSGVKIVKTPEGKLLLMSDDKEPNKPVSFTQSGGKQLVIKNNQVVSVKSMSPGKNERTTAYNTSLGKTIILKRSDLCSNSRILLSKPEKSVLKNSQLLLPQVSAVRSIFPPTTDSETNLTSSDSKMKNFDEDPIFKFKPIRLSSTIYSEASTSASTEDKGNNLPNNTSENVEGAKIDEPIEEKISKINNLSKFDETSDTHLENGDKETSNIKTRAPLNPGLESEEKSDNFCNNQDEIVSNNDDEADGSKTEAIKDLNPQTDVLKHLNEEAEGPTTIEEDLTGNLGRKQVETVAGTTLDSPSNDFIDETKTTDENSDAQEHIASESNDNDSSETKDKNCDNGEVNADHFLVNAVSGTFPSNVDNEMSTQIKSTPAATLTHRQNAAHYTDDTNLSHGISTIGGSNIPNIASDGGVVQRVKVYNVASEDDKNGSTRTSNVAVISYKDEPVICKTINEVMSHENNVLNYSRFSATVSTKVLSENKDGTFSRYMEDQGNTFDALSNTKKGSTTFAEKMDIDCTDKNTDLVFAKPTIDITENGSNSDTNTTEKVSDENKCQNIENRLSNMKTISNLVNQDALLKICNTAIQNECAKIQVINNINVSVSVTISTEGGQKTSEMFSNESLNVPEVPTSSTENNMKNDVKKSARRRTKVLNRNSRKQHKSDIKGIKSKNAMITAKIKQKRQMKMRNSCSESNGDLPNYEEQSASSSIIKDVTMDINNIDRVNESKHSEDSKTLTDYDKQNTSDMCKANIEDTEQNISDRAEETTITKGDQENESIYLKDSKTLSDCKEQIETSKDCNEYTEHHPSDTCNYNIEHADESLLKINNTAQADKIKNADEENTKDSKILSDYEEIVSGTSKDFNENIEQNPFKANDQASKTNNADQDLKLNHEITQINDELKPLSDATPEMDSLINIPSEMTSKHLVEDAEHDKTDTLTNEMILTPLKKKRKLPKSTQKHEKTRSLIKKSRTLSELVPSPSQIQPDNIPNKSISRSLLKRKHEVQTLCRKSGAKNLLLINSTDSDSTSANSETSIPIPINCDTINNKEEVANSSIGPLMSEKESSDSCSSINEDENCTINGDKILNGFRNYKKFPSSKQITNIVVHTLQPEDMKLYINGVEKEEQASVESNVESNVFIEKGNVSPTPTTNGDNITENNLSSTNNEPTDLCESQIKRTIKYVTAKVNSLFTIDKNSFSKSSKKRSQSKKTSRGTSKKNPMTLNFSARTLNPSNNVEDNRSEPGRNRKGMITINDLFYATNVLDNENGGSGVAKTIKFLCESTKISTPIIKPDKQRFLRNAKLVEKCIDIKNMKKKLLANIGDKK